MSLSKIVELCLLDGEESLKEKIKDFSSDVISDDDYNFDLDMETLDE